MISKLFVLSAAFLLAADAESRVWMDKHGEKIAEAALGGVEGGSVRLVTAGGETLVVALDVLSAGDRAFIAANTPRDWGFNDGSTITGTLVKKAGVQLHLKDEQGQTHVVAFDSLIPADRRFAEEQLRKLRLANPRFIRVLRNTRGEPIALETSIARYTGKTLTARRSPLTW